MQRYLSYRYGGTDVQADRRRRSCTYGRAPNGIDWGRRGLSREYVFRIPSVS